MDRTSLLGSLATLLFGVVSLVNPNVTANVTNLTPIDAAGRSEITTVFGGTFTTLGLLGLAGEERPVTLVWAGIVAARLASFRDRKAVSPETILGLLLEIGILALFLAPKSSETVEIEPLEPDMAD